MGTIVLSLDDKESKVKMMFKKGKVAEYREYNYEPTADTADIYPDYGTIFATTLKAFSEAENFRVTEAIYVLSDNYVVHDMIKTPVVFGKNQRDLIRLELQSHYPRHKMYRILSTPIEKSNGQMSTLVFMVSGKHIDAIKDALKAIKVPSKVTFESVMVANAFLAAEKKHSTALYASIDEKRTKIVVLKDKALLFFTTIPYGTDVLKLDCEIETPSVLNRSEIKIKNPDAKNVNNARFLIRTLAEMRDTLKEKYRLNDISIKYSVDPQYSGLFKGTNMEYVESVHGMNELFGAFSSGTYNKGLLFR